MLNLFRYINYQFKMVLIWNLQKFEIKFHMYKRIHAKTDIYFRTSFKMLVLSKHYLKIKSFSHSNKLLFEIFL